MRKTKKVAILIGGRSAEHHISLVSGYNLLKAIDPSKFDPCLIGITKDGSFTLQDIPLFLQQDPTPDKIKLGLPIDELLVAPGKGEAAFYRKDSGDFIQGIQAVFPLLHGPNGEDGRIQGLLETLRLPYVGTDVLSSAVCMDKIYAKKLMIEAGIPTCKYLALNKNDKVDFQSIIASLGLPFIIKPANLGSSIGITIVKSQATFEAAIQLAFEHDNRILIEEFIEGRELECAVLGNHEPLVSIPGEYVHESAFFDFETKYLDQDNISMVIPARNLSEQDIERVVDIARRTYSCLKCEGLARVDIFESLDKELYVNEINTMPGFTNTSMYPSLIEKMGINYSDLVTKLFELAIERFEQSK